MRLVGLAVVLSITLASLAAEAQQRGRLPRIGVLVTLPPPNHTEVDALRQGLRELGYVEGRDVLLDIRSMEGRGERWPDLVAELLGIPVDMLVVPTTGAALVAKRATRTIPIVASTAGALLEAGVIASLARPGGNVTGLTNSQVDLSAKRLELLKEAVPALSRVAALASPYVVSPSLGEIYVRQTASAALPLAFAEPRPYRPSATLPAEVSSAPVAGRSRSPVGSGEP